MVSKIIMLFQSASYRWVGTALALLLLAGCADAFDQTNGDLNSPVGGTLRIADQLRAQGDNEGALQFYARAVQQAPSDAVAHRKLADALEAQGDAADAADQYKALVKIVPDNIDDLCAYGRVLIELNRPSEAKEQYEAALKIDEDNTRALNGLGIAFDVLGDHAAAQANYKVALEQKPDDLGVVNNLGHSYMLSGAYDEAIKLLEPQAQDPAAPLTLRQNLAEAYGMSGMEVDAERVLKSMDLPPDQLKKELARYQAARGKTLPERLYADLGDFSTPDLAAARNDSIKKQFTGATEQLTLAITPDVEEEGGTPTFHAEASGFADAVAAKAFCETLKKGGAFCKVHAQ
jgi:Flp pilus assembly protein TadD